MVTEKHDTLKSQHITHSLNIMKILTFKTRLSVKIRKIEKEFKTVTKQQIHNKEQISILRYGAYDVDPKYLVIWIITQSDKVRDDFKNNEVLKKLLREKFYYVDYPESSINDVKIGFESEETIKRESGGDWYLHFK